MGGKSSAPTAPATPDYAGAAHVTAQGNLDATRAAASANRVNTYTPYGNLIFSQPDGGNPDKWNANIELSDTGKQLLGQQDRTSIGLGNLQDASTQRVSNSLNSPYAPIYDPSKATNSAQAEIMSRLQPQFDRDQAALETQLANQGLNRDSQAYKNALDQFGQRKNDAYQQAALQGINLGAQQQQQQYQQQTAERQMPLNELSAIRTGSQVTNPSFQNFAPQATTQGADMLGAANANYNAQLGNYNAQNAAQNSFSGGLFGLGSGLLGASKNSIFGGLLGM